MILCWNSLLATEVLGPFPKHTPLPPPSPKPGIIDLLTDNTLKKSDKTTLQMASLLLCVGVGHPWWIPVLILKQWGSCSLDTLRFLIKLLWEWRNLTLARLCILPAGAVLLPVWKNLWAPLANPLWLDADWILQDFCLDQDASQIRVYSQTHSLIASIICFLCSLKRISWQLLTWTYRVTWRFASKKSNLGLTPRVELLLWLSFSVFVKVILAITQETHNVLHAYACLGEYRTHIRIKMLIRKRVVCIKLLKGFMRSCNKLSKEYGFGCERRKTQNWHEGFYS